ncbi:hypothetical protein PG994_006600 [Apiospora phragmitis]|uniref:Aminoglycoside phosphotransferase domain-containing protein n=1 Tax=Apiospora phragmitis TaxID=2905665 RepID=A0ABR1VFI3_9PEZI
MQPNSQHPSPGLITRLLVVLFVTIRNQKYVRRLWNRLWKPSPGLLSVSNMCIKVKPFPTLAEADAMRYVAEHTSIPVPKVHCAFIHKGRTYIVMSRIRGKMAWYGWTNRTEESKSKVLAQLRAIVTELRSVPPPNGASVSAIDGGPFYDGRLPSKEFWGPFATTRDFHQALVGDVDIVTDYPELPDDAVELFRFYRQADTKLVLTHGDLSSLNTMVEGDEVMGILDWETADWFPPYWEYTCAKYVNP